MQRLNDAAAEMKHTIRLTTTEAQQAPIELTDEIALDVTLDSNTFLRAGADVRMNVGGEMPDMLHNLQAMDEASAKALAKGIYRTLDDETRNTLEEGL